MYPINMSVIEITSVLQTASNVFKFSICLLILLALPFGEKYSQARSSHRPTKKHIYISIIVGIQCICLRRVRSAVGLT